MKYKTNVHVSSIRVCPFQKKNLSMQHMKWAATQGAVAVMGTVWHSGPCADKPGDLRAPLVQQQQWCYVSQWPFITRQAGCTAVPFAIWHRHAVLACDRFCTTVVPGVTNDLLDCLFPVFSSHKELFVWRWPPMQPRATLMNQEVVAACLLRWYLPQIKRVCVCVCLLTAGLRFDIHV